MQRSGNKASEQLRSSLATARRLHAARARLEDVRVTLACFQQLANSVALLREASAATDKARWGDAAAHAVEAHEPLLAAERVVASGGDAGPAASESLLSAQEAVAAVRAAHSSLLARLRALALEAVEGWVRDVTRQADAVGAALVDAAGRARSSAGDAGQRRESTTATLLPAWLPPRRDLPRGVIEACSALATPAAVREALGVFHALGQRQEPLQYIAALVRARAGAGCALRPPLSPPRRQLDREAAHAKQGGDSAAAAAASPSSGAAAGEAYAVQADRLMRLLLVWCIALRDAEQAGERGRLLSLQVQVRLARPVPPPPPPALR